MKLYHAKNSPNSRRVRIYLAEKKLEIPMIAVDLGAKEQFSDAYRAINPRMVVPTMLLSNNYAIGEVPAIWRYVEERFPDLPLMGRTVKEKALITMWERRAELEGFSAVMEAVRNGAQSLKGRALSGPHDYEQIPALVERGKARTLDFYADLNERLADSPYVANDHYTVADITAMVTVDFATAAINLPIPDGHHDLRRWYNEVAARPSSRA